MHCLHLPISIRTSNKSTSGIYIERLADAQSDHDDIEQVGIIGIRPVRYTYLYWVIRGKKSLPRTKVDYDPSMTRIDWNMTGYDKRRGKGSLLYANKVIDLFELYQSQYGEPDIIHAHSGRGAGLAALLIKSVYGVPYVVTEHNPAYIEGGLEEERDQLETVYHNSERIYGVSEGMHDGIRKFTDKMPRTFPNVIDSSFIEYKPEDPGGKQPYYLHVGRFDGNKGQKVAIDAIKMLNNRVEQTVKIKFAGEGKYLQKQKEYAKKRGVEQNVDFLGFVNPNELPELYSGAVATLVCSKKESFGLPIIESMATGTPVIATPTVGAKSISARTSCGLYIIDREVDLFVSQMFDLLSSSNIDRSEISNTVKREYSREAIAELSVREYQSIMM